MIIRSKTFKQWFHSQFSRQEMREIYNHGAGGGFRFLTFFHDTVKLYDRFEDELWEMLSRDASDLGYDNVCSMIGELPMGIQIDTSYEFKNFVVWYAAEQLASEAVSHC